MSLLTIAEPGQSTVASCKRRVVGIDLGTTNSLVAQVLDGAPRVLPDAAGQMLLPSVVHYAQGVGPVLVGEEAAALATAWPRDTIASVKRFMGRGPRDAEATRRMTPYELAGDDGPVVRFRAGGRLVTPVEVSAEILRVLRLRAEEALGGPLDGAVITVPAYFDDAQRQATRDAGRLAGLEVLRLLAEPTAAALAYGLDKGSQGLFAVYDLGGGTFDISILRLVEGVFEVKATAGDTALGGDDFDRAIAAMLLGELGQPDGGGDPTLVRRALAAARAAREGLSEREEIEVEMEMELGVELNRTKRTLRTLRRAEMEELVRGTLERTGVSCRRALRDAGLAATDLDGVILVGGATRMPLVRRYVADIFGRQPLADIDPDQVVALGAAVQADLLAGETPREDVLLLDVIPLSLGVETMGGVVEKLIPRNSTIPAGARQVFTTFADRQTGFDIHVVQGERELVDQCRSLARFQLKGIPPMPAGLARMEITFLVDADGILRVSARELPSGRQATVEVRPSYGLSDEEIERMLLDSFEHAEDDIRKRQLSEARVEAERVLAALRVALANDGPALLVDGEQAAIEAAATALTTSCTGEDAAAIRAAIETLDQASREFAQRRMDSSISEALRERRVEEIERLSSGGQDMVGGGEGGAEHA